MVSNSYSSENDFVLRAAEINHYNILLSYYLNAVDGHSYYIKMQNSANFILIIESNAIIFFVSISYADAFSEEIINKNIFIFSSGKIEQRVKQI